MSNMSLLKNMTAGAAINAFTIVKVSAAETVITATANTDLILGVTTDVAPASGERTDVCLEGIAFVTAGAAVPLGTLVTTDASGRAIAAAPGAGVNCRVLGIAIDAAAALGDVIRVFLSPCSMQG